MDSKELAVKMGDIAVAGNVQVTQDTLVAYQVAVCEEEMEKQAAGLQKDIDGLNQKIQDIGKEIDTEVDKQVKSQYGSKVSQMNKLMKEMFATKEKDYFTISGQIEDGKITVSMDGERCYSGFGKVKGVALCKELSLLIKDRSDTQKEVNELYNDLSKLNLALSRVDRMQRQASRRMMDALAEKNPELRKVLDRMIGK